MSQPEKLKPFGYMLAAFTVFSCTLAACVEDPATGDDDIAAEATPETGSEVQDETVGGDGSELALQPLGAADLSDQSFNGELGCTFTLEPGGDPLLLALGFVGDAEGRAEFAAKWGNVLSRGLSTEPGGFDVLADGSGFSTRGMQIEIDRTSDEAAGEGESPLYPATLTAMRADGAERSYEGFWTCGP